MRELIVSQRRPKGEDGYRTFSIRIREETVTKLNEIHPRQGGAGMN